jgi:hypothetical protein
LANNAPEYYVKPAVLVIKTPDAAEEVISEILLGIEEEGIPAGVQIRQRGEAVNLAKGAADGSSLNVGIGASAVEVAVHHRDLPAVHPLFLLSKEKLTATNLRCLGTNAARLVKGNPLVLNDDLLKSGTDN